MSNRVVVRKAKPKKKLSDKLWIALSVVLALAMIISAIVPLFSNYF